MSNEILQNMLNDIDPKYDKRVGSFVYDVLAPASKEIKKINDNLSTASEKISVVNLKREELAERIFERSGIERRSATKAIGEVTVIGTGIINIGALFETLGGIQFEATENKSISGIGNVNVRCLTPGSVGEVPPNTILLFPVTLAGFTDVTNNESTYDGFEQETDDDLLLRYFEYIRKHVTSGNKLNYSAWAKAIDGVGEVKVESLWNGPGTVRIIIINSNRQTASEELIAEVYNYIEEVRPIGANVTVVSGNSRAINITSQILLLNGYTIEQIQSSFTNKLIEYFTDIAFKENRVLYSKVGSILLSVVGVSDYSNLLINSGTTNINLESDEFAMLGTVNLGGV
jgi:uncharacterized phage protein gp47/JayE